jgi:hypothetical protein
LFQPHLLRGFATDGAPMFSIYSILCLGHMSNRRPAGPMTPFHFSGEVLHGRVVDPIVIERRVIA